MERVIKCSPNTENPHAAIASGLCIEIYCSGMGRHRMCKLSGESPRAQSSPKITVLRRQTWIGMNIVTHSGNRRV